MWTKLLSLCGVVLFLAACETTPQDSGQADGTGANQGGANTAGQQDAGTNGDGMEVARVDQRSLQEILAQDVGDRVFFDYDKSLIRPDGQRTLRRQAEFLRANPTATITIEGRCDERGTREYNLALGDRRANAAKDFLVSLGISPDRIRTISYGKERPVVLGHDEAAWAQNRVGISVLNS